MNENEAVTRKILNDVLDERFGSFKSEMLKETKTMLNQQQSDLMVVLENMTSQLEAVHEAVKDGQEVKAKIDTDIEPRLTIVEQKIDLIQNT